MNSSDNITFRKQRALSKTSCSEDSANNSKLDGSSSSLPNMSGYENSAQIEEFKLKIEQLTSELKLAQHTIKCLTTENSELKNKVSSLQTKESTWNSQTCNSNNNNKNTSVTELNNQDKTHQVHNIIPKDLVRPRKVCILSTNNRNKILTIAENTFPDYKICHYLTPGCGIEKLIKNIDLKLKNYTMEDYCLIFIGEADFRRTNNYVDLIITLRETLLKIDYTNIIICAPTFKLDNYSMMFNGRIETFNSLLYLDACTHQYAYLFDTNFYLSYDFKMFSPRSRSVNNNGLVNIFKNINLMLDEISSRENVHLTDRDDGKSPPISLSCTKDNNIDFFL